MKKYALAAFLFQSVITFACLAGVKARVPANISELEINCGSPKGFAGLSASVSGKLSLSPLSNGATRAIGKLKISLLNPASPWSGEKKVLGQYDDLTSVGSERYFHGGATMKNADDILEIYVNFGRPELSFVEYDGANYKMSCK